MKYTIENFKDVVEDTAIKDKEKIDELLRVDAIIYCNMGPGFKGLKARGKGYN